MKALTKCLTNYIFLLESAFEELQQQSCQEARNVEKFRKLTIELSTELELMEQERDEARYWAEKLYKQVHNL